MKNHKNKIIVIVVVLAVLSVAWFWGGNYSKQDNSAPRVMTQTSEAPSQSENTRPIAERQGDGSIVSPETADARQEGQGEGSVVSPETADELPEPTRQGDGSVVSPEVNSDSPESGSRPTVSPGGPVEQNRNESNVGDNAVPSEPQSVAAGDGSFTVTLSVRCDTILDNMNLLNKEKHELVPPDGVIYPVTEVTAFEGESVINVLMREMRRERIHMEFRNTPIYNSVYLLAINNLYEFDVGELSGLMYKVNGLFPSFGSSRYQLLPGDAIEFVYSCDLGADVGGSYAAGAQN